MDAEEFRKRGKEMIDYVADYLENIENRRVLPDVQPGYLSKLIPTEAPQEAEKWEDLFKDIERVIMPGVTHWHNPNFHAFFPTANSYPAIIADILSSGIACIGFSWISSPACTELEVVTMDWLAKMLELPDFFLAESNGLGGGVIQGTASEAVLVALLGARNRTLDKARQQYPGESDGVLFSKMVAYSSDQVHSAMPRATLMAAVKSRTIPSDDNFVLRGDAFEKAVEEDIANGLIPIYLCATLGTTPSCAFDPLTELGPVCEKHGIWMHVDAAYAGSSFICPEFRPLMKGVEYAESFDFNPHKWMEVNFDCSAMWIKDRSTVVNAFNVDPIFLRHQYQNVAPDYRHWQIPLGRRFRSLKLWFVLRLYGVTGLQAFIRKHVVLAHELESMIKSDDRFELGAPVVLGLVCFRYKGTNEQNEALLKRINDEGKIYMVPCTLSGKFTIRFAVAASRTESRHIEFAWQTIVANLEGMLVPASTSGAQQ